MKLAQLLDPFPVDEFLAEYYNARPLHIPGEAGRFADLTPAAATALEQQLERDLEAPVHGKLRQDWAGHELERAPRDRMVLQAAGGGLWTGNGRGPEQPAAEAVWEARLEAGGVVYIPRGWWCAAPPQSAPARAWIFEIENPTGADLLLWLAERLGRTEAFQSDIPRFADPCRQAAYMAGLRQTVGGAFRAPGLLLRYTRRLNRTAPAHDGAGSGNGSTIVFRAARYPRLLRADAETVGFRMHGQTYLFPLDAAQLLQYLLDHAPAPLAAFYQEFEGQFDREELADFLSALCRDEIVAID